MAMLRGGGGATASSPPQWMDAATATVKAANGIRRRTEARRMGPRRELRSAATNSDAGAGCPQGAMSPYLDAFRGRSPHPVAGLDAERHHEGVVVHEGHKGPVLTRRMFVGQELLAQRIVEVLRPPDLGEAKEEALIASKAADD